MKKNKFDDIGKYVGEIIPKNQIKETTSPDLKVTKTESENTETKKKELLTKEEGVFSKILKSRWLKPIQVLLLVSKLSACADMSTEKKEYDTIATDGGSSMSIKDNKVREGLDSRLTKIARVDMGANKDNKNIDGESSKTENWNIQSPLDHRAEDSEKLIYEVTAKINSSIDSPIVDETGMRTFLDVLNKVHTSTENEDGTKTNSEPLFDTTIIDLFFSDAFQNALNKEIKKSGQDKQISYMKGLSAAKAVADFFKIETGEEFSNSKISDKELNKAVKFVFDQLEKNGKRELLSEKSSVINLVHYDFDGSEVLDLAKKVGVDKKKIQVFKTEKDRKPIQLEEFKKGFLKAIADAKGPTTLFLNVHGDRFNNATENNEGQVEMGEVINVISLGEGLKVTMQPSELANAMIASGNIENFSLVNNDCSAEPFIRELLDLLGGSGKMVNLAVGVDGKNKKAWSHNGKSGFTMLLDESMSNKKNSTAITLNDVVEMKGKLAVREGRKIFTAVNQAEAAKMDVYGHSYAVVN